jgi:hypothetical protein
MLKKFSIALVALMSVLTGSLSVSAPAFAASAYYYAAGAQDLNATQEASATAVTASVTVYSPAIAVGSGDHSLGELAVQTDNGSGAPTRTGVVEVGWNVDFNLYGDYNPHAFVYSWVNNVGRGYNTFNPDFVACTGSGGTCGGLAAPVVAAGATMTSGTTYKMTITRIASAWWFGISVGTGAGCSGTNCYLGYIPDTAFSGASPSVSFTTLKYVQAFGEVYDANTATGVCADMANGVNATSTTGGVIGSVSYAGLATSDVNLGRVVTNASYYELVMLGTAGNYRTFRYGGDGSDGLGASC